MTWTKTPPSAPGWYWWREFSDSLHEDWTVTLVEKHDGKLLGFDLLGHGEDITTLDVEWWSEPIQRPGDGGDATKTARRFHEAYERLAPSFGYVTRKVTRKFDPDSPNGRLMIAVCAEVARHGEGTDPLMLLDTETGKVTLVECDRCGKVDWRAVADYALGMAQGLALGCRVTSAEVQQEYDAAVARHTKGG